MQKCDDKATKLKCASVQLSNNGADNRDESADSWPTGILRRSKQQRFGAKDVIYRESDQVDRVFLIRHGVVKLLRYLPNGRSRIVRLHTRGDWLGLEALVGFPYEHTAVAVGDVQVDHVSVRNLQRLEWRSPRQFSRVLSQWHSHLVQADKWISDLSTGGIKPRVARLLAFLSDLEYGSSSDLVELLTVHEMADMLGVTQESVSRILAGFKRDAILRKHAGSGRDVYHFDNVRLMQESAM